jgi:hypothetical protein
MALLVAAPFEAKAYADPGTGVFFYQALMAALMGVVWTGRRVARRLFTRTSEKAPK